VNGSRAPLAILALALIALAVWPAFVTRMNLDSSSTSVASAAAVDAIFTPAPVTRDYLVRDGLVSFYERAVRRTPSDQIMARMLAGQYLMRFRERGDVGDLKRARIAASRSLMLQPRHNDGAETELGSVALSLHDFRAAQRYYEDVTRMAPWNHDSWANLASADMELGEYAAARQVLAKSQGPYVDAARETSLARYDELTGDLRRAQSHLTVGMQQIDSVIDNPAEARAWYHFRAGELAFENGDARGAERDLHDALAIYPDDAKAYNTLARIYCATHRWREALAAADKAAELMPLPETLGYEFDAQRELGDKPGAAETQDLIFAIQRIGNANGINDRAIAVYESEHGLRLGDAVLIARRDLASRDDLYAEDTLAWALAMDGRFGEARPHAARAVAVGTRDSRVLFHAGWISFRLGDQAKARLLLQSALAVNPEFHPYYADWARAALRRLVMSR
jgi:tetratricopeptide (TPR) repeat protein